MPMILGGSGTINTSSSLAVAVAGVEDVRIDASGNTRFLSNATFFKTDGNPGKGSKIFLAGSDTGDQWIGAGQNSAYWMEYSGNPNEGHVFRTGSVERMVISGSNSNGKVPANSISLNPFSAGYVLMPYQPYACASYSGGDLAINNVIPINANITSRGGISTSSNRFTVPITGAYVVGYSHLAAAVGGQIGIRRNGTLIAGSRSQGSGAHYCLATLRILELAANDYIEFQTINQPIHGNSDYNSMWIYLFG